MRDLKLSALFLEREREKTTTHAHTFTKPYTHRHTYTWVYDTSIPYIHTLSCSNAAYLAHRLYPVSTSPTRFPRDTSFSFLRIACASLTMALAAPLIATRIATCFGGGAGLLFFFFVFFVTACTRKRRRGRIVLEQKISRVNKKKFMNRLCGGIQDDAKRKGKRKER